MQVNGQEARFASGNVGEWEVILKNVPPGELQLTAQAEDAAGNREARPHVLTVQVRKER